MTATRPRPAWSDDDVEAFRDLAHSFLAKECAPHEERWAEQQHIDREVWNRAGGLGLLCPSIPTEYGGGGGALAPQAGVGRGANPAPPPRPGAAPPPPHR